jgi:hypothetical protein
LGLGASAFFSTALGAAAGVLETSTLPPRRTLATAANAARPVPVTMAWTGLISMLAKFSAEKKPGRFSCSPVFGVGPCHHRGSAMG